MNALCCTVLFLIIIVLLLIMMGKPANSSFTRYMRLNCGRFWPFAIVLTLFILGLLCAMSDVLSFTNPDHEYGIMFDAGSTGSRIHVFKFKMNEFTGQHQLVDELFVQVKPGLSSYADRPKEGAESLRPMLDRAYQFVPESQWSSTPVALKATAGLRLLPEKSAQRLLDEVLQLFKSYKFKISEDSVSILEGTDEGLYCWFTVNFLRGLLTSSEKTVGVLDLGGGSMQITYLSSAALTTKTSNRHVKVDIFGSEHSLYSHSYLGLGLNSGRFQILGGKESAEEVKPGTFYSACLPERHESAWKHSGKQHTIRGLNNVSSRFDECFAAVQRFVKSYEMDRPAELSTTQFYALSYYVDRAGDVAIVDPKHGGNLTVQDFYSAAQRECKLLNSEDPFRCLDMCYIFSLLHDGLGLPKSATLHLQKQIRKIEIAWPLGAIFNVYGKFRRKN